jgi:D-mannonate dehydratase
MKVGIHAFSRDSHTAAGVERARQAGAEAVCLSVEQIDGRETHGVPELDALKAAVGLYDAAGIPATHGYAGRWSNELMLDDPARAEEFDRLVATLRGMAAVGMKGVLFYTTPEKPSDPTEVEAVFDRFVAFCNRLGAVTDDLGIGIACHPWVSRPELLHGFKRLHQMTERVPHASLGITYCPGGALAGDDMHWVREAFAGRIHFAHLRDQIGDYRSFEEVFPGTGTVGIPGVIQALAASGYDGLLCPEHLGPEPPGRDVEAEAVAYAKSLRDTAA